MTKSKHFYPKAVQIGLVLIIDIIIHVLLYKALLHVETAEGFFVSFAFVSRRFSHPDLNLPSFPLPIEKKQERQHALFFSSFTSVLGGRF